MMSVLEIGQNLALKLALVLGKIEVLVFSRCSSTS
jgi:hypothetical protein